MRARESAKWASESTSPKEDLEWSTALSNNERKGGLSTSHPRGQRSAPGTQAALCAPSSHTYPPGARKRVNTPPNTCLRLEFRHRRMCPVRSSFPIQLAICLQMSPPTTRGRDGKPPFGAASLLSQYLTSHLPIYGFGLSSVTAFCICEQKTHSPRLSPKNANGYYMGIPPVFFHCEVSGKVARCVRPAYST